MPKDLVLTSEGGPLGLEILEMPTSPIRLFSFFLQKLAACAGSLNPQHPVAAEMETIFHISAVVQGFNYKLMIIAVKGGTPID